MNSADVADQLLNSYNFLHWMKNYKWWLKLVMWVFVVMIANEYILYKISHIVIWRKKKDEVLSLYEFRKEI